MTKTKTEKRGMMEAASDAAPCKNTTRTANGDVLFREETTMSAEEQTRILADYIMANVPGEPSRSEGTGECAVRLLSTYRKALMDIITELEKPSENYPAPVANAYEIAEHALDGTSL